MSYHNYYDNFKLYNKYNYPNKIYLFFQEKYHDYFVINSSFAI